VSRLRGRAGCSVPLLLAGGRARAAVGLWGRGVGSGWAWCQRGGRARRINPSSNAPPEVPSAAAAPPLLTRCDLPPPPSFFSAPRPAPAAWSFTCIPLERPGEPRAPALALPRGVPRKGHCRGATRRCRQRAALRLGGPMALPTRLPRPPHSPQRRQPGLRRGLQRAPQGPRLAHHQRERHRAQRAAPHGIRPRSVGAGLGWPGGSARGGGARRPSAGGGPPPPRRRAAGPMAAPAQLAERGRGNPTTGPGRCPSFKGSLCPPPQSPPASGSRRPRPPPLTAAPAAAETASR
jgi:hypothetical protein